MSSGSWPPAELETAGRGAISMSLVRALSCATCLILSACNSNSSRSETETNFDNPIAVGHRIYLERCAACHGEQGNGVGEKFPPLAAAPWVTDGPTRLTALVLDGMTGKRKVGSVEYQGVMPGWRGVLTAPETAVVLTYIRQAWGNNASAVSTGLVHQVGNRFESRRSFWTVSELEALPND